MDGLWLRLALALVRGVRGALAALLCIGMAPDTPPQRWAVAVVGKRGDADPKIATLLREDGSTHEVPVVGTIHAMLRAGDCGVAEVTCLASGTPVIVVAFYRL